MGVAPLRRLWRIAFRSYDEMKLEAEELKKAILFFNKYMSCVAIESDTPVFQGGDGSMATPSGQPRGSARGTPLARPERTEPERSERKMGKNIRHIMRATVMNNFRENRDKRAEKMENRGTVGVWSYGTRADLLDKTNAFCAYLSARGINRPHDVDKDVIHDFLEQKAIDGCTQRTVDAYRSAIGRIGDLMGRDWHADNVLALKTHKRASDRGAEDVMSKEDRDKICDYCERNPSGSANAILLEREIGIRVSDMAYGAYDRGDRLEIHGKGGRICTREVTPRIREIVDRMETMEDGRLTLPKDASINRYLNRVEDRLELERHSFHSMRRCSAQEKYDEFRNNGMERLEALNAVGQWLSHGALRADMVLESYVGRAW